MNARELRIGNYVQDSTTNELIMVSAYTITQIVEHSWKAKPIELSEEWLKKFGFKGTEFLLGKGNFIYNKEKKVLTWYGIMLQDSLYNEVHKVQNIYFALTGEEL
jgi:hypothetical protein